MPVHAAANEPNRTSSERERRRASSVRFSRGDVDGRSRADASDYEGHRRVLRRADRSPLNRNR